ncbi:terminal uridylyltransferase 7-like isoform X1 [Clavelina lepadiformis]|uniref:terminal uridylyltransferase 7-like isoform X1 n=2 Tax=Clavelina lepadiformis TaxID=159417 RepID=UPI0040415E79
MGHCFRSVVNSWATSNHFLKISTGFDESKKLSFHMKARLCMKSHKMKEEHKSHKYSTSLVESICLQCYKRNIPTSADVAKQERLYKKLHSCLNATSKNPVSLYQFGSTVNGFGFRNSDVDLYVAGISLIQAKAILKQTHDFTNVVLIRCRIPVLKFFYRPSGLLGDVTATNKVAHRNTKLLHRYSTISLKSKIAIYAFKYLAKSCHLSDVDSGFISSYAFTILAIYYLQQIEPPALPVLQELQSFNQVPTMISGFNTSFFDGSEKELARIWCSYGRNEYSASQLFLGMLDFYANKFDYENHVVSIRQRSIERRRESRFDNFVIEDPFENRNLASRISVQKLKLIQDFFSKAYSHFAQLQNHSWKSTKPLESRFNPGLLLHEETCVYVLRGMYNNLKEMKTCGISETNEQYLHTLFQMEQFMHKLYKRRRLPQKFHDSFSRNFSIKSLHLL